MRFYKKQFQWDLFKKLFIVRHWYHLGSIMHRDSLSSFSLQNSRSSVLAYFFLYLFKRISLQPVSLHQLLQTQWKVWFKFCLKHISFYCYNLDIQAVYNLIFGLYISHIFTRQRALISSLVLQVYANFLGYPEYFEILKGNLSDERVKSTFNYIVRVCFVLFGGSDCLPQLLFINMIYIYYILS